MSVDIDWETLTGGPDGHALADAIRDFIHERFQHIHLPKLIRSVKVSSFDFGKMKPEIVLKDIGDPLPDFYEDDENDTPAQNDHPHEDEAHEAASETITHLHGVAAPQAPPSRVTDSHARRRDIHRRASEFALTDEPPTPALTRGVLGGTSGLGYFHLPLSGGLSGTSTPLAAVAGAHWYNGLPRVDEGQQLHHHRQSSSFNSVTPPTLTPVSSRPVSRDQAVLETRGMSSGNLDGSIDQPLSRTATEVAGAEPDPEDIQVVFHLTYSGDVRLSMTAEVFLDYPMPSFVGIPLKLNITAATFNGIGILAYIKRRAHLCFLSPEDAAALVGADVSPASSQAAGEGEESEPNHAKVGALLEEIKIESEMGETGDGRQVLKNVGKIEKFILEQVQRIFEDEFVYPSFWTFLV